MLIVFGERLLVFYNRLYIVYDVKCFKIDWDCIDSIDILKIDIDKLMLRVMYFFLYIYKMLCNEWI